MKIRRIIFVLSLMITIVACCTVLSNAASLGKVDGINQTYASEDTVGIAFNRVSGADYYEVYISSSKTGTYTYKTECYDEDDSYIDELASGKHYFIKLRAYYYDDDDNKIYGTYSEPYEIVTSPECKIKNFKQSSIKSDSSVLTWDKVEGIDGYMIEQGKNKFYTDTNSITVNIEGSYDYVTVYGYCKSTTFTAIDKDNYQEVEVYAKPSVPSNIKQTECYNSSMEISCKSDYSVDRFQVYYSSKKEGTYELLKNFTYTDMYLDKLSAGKHYYLKIRKGVHNSDTDQWIYGDFSKPFHAITGLTGKVKNIKQSNIKTDSVTITWDKVTNADYYIVEYGSTKKTVTGLSCVIPIKTKNKERSVYITPVIKSDTIKDEGTDSSVSVCPKPTQLTGVKCAYYWIYSASADIEWKSSYYEDGFQYKLYDNKGKCIKTVTKKSADAYVSLYDLSLSKFYSFKVRSYKVVQGNKVYGEWSKALYFTGGPKVSGKRTKSAINVSWKKVAGATNYTIYISKAASGGYKKVATTTKLNYSIKKYAGKKLAKSQYYCVKVVANKKVGKVTYKSTDPDYLYL